MKHLNESELAAVDRESARLWVGDAAVRREFDNEDTFKAFRRAEARGLVKIHHSHYVRGEAMRGDVKRGV